MRAAVLHGPEDLRIDDVDTPAPGPGEIVLAVRAATTCATDVKMYRRGHPALGPYPARFGHEFAGEVVARGEGVTAVTVGELVFCADSAPCRACPPCRRGQMNLCEDLQYLLGGFGEHLLVPARVASRNLHGIPPGVPLARAPIAEPLACALRAADPFVGESAVVLGAGAIGLFLCACLSLRGARVTLVDPHPDRLALGRRFGAADIVVATKGPEDADAVRGLGGGRGADWVFEAVGRPEAWQAAVAMAAPGATVTFVGGCPRDTTISVPTQRLHYDELTLRGSYHHTPGHIARALDLLSEPAIPWDQLVGPAIALDDLPGLMASGLPSNTGQPKLLVDPLLRREPC
jgi:L-iditol 2-dehydrogenase